MFKPVQKKGVLSREELEKLRNKKELKKGKPLIKQDKAQNLKKAVKSKKQKLTSAFNASTPNTNTSTQLTNVTLNSTLALSNLTSTSTEKSMISSVKLTSKTTILPTTSIATTTTISIVNVVKTSSKKFTLSGAKLTNNGVISVSGYLNSYKGETKYSKEKITDGNKNTFWHSELMAESSFMNYVLNTVQTITEVTVSKRAGLFYHQADSSWFHSYF